MAALGPFEAPPRVAVAVSGGSDSLALTLLAVRWAAARGGDVLALTVDHGLRDGSADEARRVGSLLAGRGIAHQVLGVHIDRATGLQAAARSARYDALERAAAEAGILHLLVGHTAQDQAETIRLRTDRASGPDGLAGMAPIVELHWVRLLRPLLAMRRSDLMATCRAAGVDWIEDPANRDPRFARARLRLEGRVAPPRGIVATRRARNAHEARLADLLARHVAVAAEGYALADLAALVAAASPAEGRAAVAALLRAIGGLAYPPRGSRLDRLAHALATRPPAVATLGGCVLRRLPDGRHRIAREPEAIRARLAPAFCTPPTVWDGRFLLNGLDAWAGGDATVAPLGRGRPRLSALPAEISAGWPALWQGRSLIAAPELAEGHVNLDGVARFGASFAPRTPLVAPPFDVVWPSEPPMY
ncbi:MAG: tRNA lysidine(34) synthetase TilS [Rhodospirillaceae bacterium]|nr:tRNA lysidine(34) synthetase TilS [Rhodospirillaceae bacterium]